MQKLIQNLLITPSKLPKNTKIYTQFYTPQTLHKIPSHSFVFKRPNSKKIEPEQQEQVQQQQQQVNKKSEPFQQPKKPQQQATQGVQKIFLDKSKFSNEDDGLIIYFSKEEKFFRGFSASILLFLGYNIYQCNKSEQIEDKQNHYYLACIFGVLFVFMQYRIHKCPKTIWLDKDGKTTFIDFYRFGGFSSSPIELENMNFRGYGSWMHKVTNTPVFYYRYNGKKKFAFFKKSEVTEPEILKNVFIGKLFNVTTKGLEKQFSKKTKGRYSL